jgi:hypothetical protein
MLVQVTDQAMNTRKRFKTFPKQGTGMMKNIDFAERMLLLLALLIGGPGCHLLLPFSSSSIQTYAPYRATAEVYRSLPGGLEFTETWQMYGWPKPEDLDKDGDTDLADTTLYFEGHLKQYIWDFMAPNFTWQYRNLTVVSDSEKKSVGDCSPADGGISCDQPLTFGAPIGAELVWSSPSSSQASAWCQLFYEDGNGIANPQVRKVVMRFAERGGFPDMWTGVYNPETRHLRFSDMYLELEPFDLDNPDDAHVTDVFIQSIGTAFARGNGIPNYDFSTDDAALFFMNASGEVAGEAGVTQVCFNNDQLAGVYERQNGSPIFNLTLSGDVFNQDGIKIASVLIELHSPAGTVFAQHQPYLELQDKTTTDKTVTLTPDVALDKDNDLDRFLWFEDFETSTEQFLGQGQSVTPANPFSLGKHKITVVAYDKRGAYNSATMTLEVKNAPPVAVCKDVTVSADGPCTAAASVDNGSYDPEGGSLSYVQAPPGPYSLGKTSVTLEVTDPDGGKASCTAEVTVQDDTPPTISCPGNVTANATSPSGATVTFAEATASDNCSASVSRTCTPVSGSTFAIGTSTVTCTAVDDSGNAATCTFTVKVKSPAEQTADLIGMVQKLPNTKLDPGVRNALLVKLQAALAAINTQNKASACQPLQDFINLVKAQSGKKLDQASATSLINEATRIRTVLGCP